jgi:hypothetical protein
MLLYLRDAERLATTALRSFLINVSYYERLITASN